MCQKNNNFRRSFRNHTVESLLVMAEVNNENTNLATRTSIESSTGGNGGDRRLILT
jgi:hypothetical protein